VRYGEADAVCIAGMGANAMTKILQSSAELGIADLERLNTQRLILQLTNSRPRNLFKVYKMLQQSGWVLLDERIEFLSGMWYISCCFAHSRQNSDQLERMSYPTAKLALLEEEDAMKLVTRDYWLHHLNWIEREDKASSGQIRKEDATWRAWVQSAGFL